MNAVIADARRNYPRVGADLVQQAAALPASILADVYGRRGTVSGRIAALAPTMKVAGPALTVEVRPGDNLMITVNPGDLVVGDADGVVVIERARVAEMIELGGKKVADERKRLDGIARREQLTPGWLAGALKDAGVTMEEEER